MSEMNNLQSSKDNKSTDITVSDKKFNYISISKQRLDLTDRVEYVKFVKACEQSVRTHLMYRQYLAYIKTECGLNRCSLYGNISGEDAKIEMHHGPILTLFDYIEINLIKRIMEGGEISSFDISQDVLDQHHNNIIQIVMLSVAAHKAVHPTKPGVEPEFLHMKLAFGDIVKFLRQNIKYLSIDHLNKIREYILKYEKNTNNIDTNKEFKVFKEFITKWNILK